METTYAQALWQMIQKGTPAKKAVKALHDTLVFRGRTALMPRIAKAFARIAARDSERNGVTLSVAREKDRNAALRGAKKILSELGAGAGDVALHVDETLIGGWRLEGRERLLDASWKKSLVSIYNQATQ